MQTPSSSRSGASQAWAAELHPACRTALARCAAAVAGRGSWSEALSALAACFDAPTARLESSCDAAEPMPETADGLPHRICSALDSASCLVVLRPRRPFTPQDQARLEALTAELARIWATPDRPDEPGEALDERFGPVFDGVPFGVALLDPELRVLSATDRGRALVAPFLQRRGADLAFVPPERADAERLRGLCGPTAAASSADDRGRGVPRPMGISIRVAAACGREIGVRAQRVLRGWSLPLGAVAAGRRLDAGDAAADRRLLLTIADLSRPPAIDVEVIRTFWPMTRAEARVAARLAGGETLDQAAAGLGLSRETARGYLKRAFLKTGARRQGDLVRLLITAAQLGTPPRASDPHRDTASAARGTARRSLPATRT